MDLEEKAKIYKQNVLMNSMAIRGSIREIKKPLFLIPSVLLILVSLCFAYASFNPSQTTITPQQTKHLSYWCYDVDRADGTHEDLGCNLQNTVYEDGLNATRDSLMAGTNHSYLTISLCNNTRLAGYGCVTPDAGQTANFSEIKGCGLTPAQGTSAINAGSPGNWSVWKTFTSTCDSQVLNVTKLRDSNGVNLSGNAFTATTLMTNDQLTVNITLFVVGG